MRKIQLRKLMKLSEFSWENLYLIVTQIQYFQLVALFDQRIDR